jgi:hypothetical protein
MSTITVRCPECQALLKLPASLPPGKLIRCPKCQITFAPAAAEEAAEEVAIQPAAARPKAAVPPRKPLRDLVDEEGVARPTRWARKESEEDEDDWPSRSAVRRRKQAAGNPVLLWSLVGGGALLLIGGGVALFLILNQKKDEQPSAQGPLQGGPGNKLGMNRRFPMPPIPPPNAQGALWLPDPVAANHLGPELLFAGYRVRPPQGYSRSEQATRVDGRLDARASWSGPARPDQTRHTILIFARTLTPAEQQITLKQFLDQQVTLFKSRLRANVTVSPGETGLSNGLTFCRTRLLAAAGGKKLQAIVYAARDGNVGITGMSVDGEPQCQETLKLAEAAFLSLKK